MAGPKFLECYDERDHTANAFGNMSRENSMNEMLVTVRHGDATRPTDQDTLARLQRGIAQTAEAIEDRRKAFFNNPEDIETIHRFRTNTRALRSVVAVIKPWQKTRQNAETQAILKEVVRCTSRLRELDVLEKNVRADPNASPKLLTFCKDEASAERKRVLKALASKRVARSFRRAIASAKAIAWKKRYAKYGLPQDVVQARFDALIKAVGAEIAHMDLMDSEQTHDVRKRAKRVRYVAELASNTLGPDAVDVAKNMTAHQDALGDVCDARVNIRLTSEFLLRDLPKPVKKGLIRLRKQNEAILCELLESSETSR